MPNKPEEPQNQDNNYGITSEVKEELIKLSKKIEEGTLESNALTQQITGDIAKALVILAKAVEQDQIDDKELAIYLARIIRKLTRGQVKSIKKKKKKPKTFFDLVLDALMKNFVRAEVQKRNQKLKEQSTIKALTDDLNAAVTRLNNDPSLDSDINDLRLMEDVMAVSQKMAALESKINLNTKGVNNSLFRAQTAYSSVGGNKGIASLSTLKSEIATESWSEANEIDLSHATRVVGDDVFSMKHSFKLKETNIPSGPNDVPTTDNIKELKKRKEIEWANSSIASRRE